MAAMVICAVVATWCFVAIVAPWCHMIPPLHLNQYIWHRNNFTAHTKVYGSASPHVIPGNMPSIHLTHWGRVTHICAGNLIIIGSDNGLSPGRRQAVIWTNAGILLTWHMGTNFSEILIEIQTFSFKKIHLKMSSGKWRPFCLGLNVLSLYLSYEKKTSTPMHFTKQISIKKHEQWLILGYQTFKKIINFMWSCLCLLLARAMYAADHESQLTDPWSAKIFNRRDCFSYICA